LPACQRRRALDGTALQAGDRKDDSDAADAGNHQPRVWSGYELLLRGTARHSLSITRKAHLQGNGRGLKTVKVTPLNPIAGGIVALKSAEDADPSTPIGSSPVLPVEKRRELRLVAQMIEFPPGVAASILEGFCETSGLLYVLDGQLQLDAGGMRENLDAGDCVCIESDMSMAWSAAGKHRCRVMAVFPTAVWLEA